MRLAQLRLFAVACATLFAAFATSVVAAVDRGIGLLFETLAFAPRIFTGTPRLALDGPAPTYDAPPVHSLRHEANVSRRSADRHI